MRNLEHDTREDAETRKTIEHDTLEDAPDKGQREKK